MQSLSHKTARLYLCAVGYQCKIQNVNDVTKNFILAKIILGMQKAASKGKSRLPITISLLSSIVAKLPAVCTNAYEVQLFTAAFCLAFFGFFRIGEITVTKKEYIHKIVAKNDITLDTVNGKLTILLRYSKTDQSGKGVTLTLSQTDTSICPVKSTKAFLAVRPKLDGPLLCHLNGKTLTRYQFSAVLKKALTCLSVNYGYYKAHSFRIGAATTASKLGHSVETIKQAGRWSSDAYRLYIKPNQEPSVLPNLV